jgi:xylulose-5-phosphate/fructose-6-phosphate phosphoketolase
LAHEGTAARQAFNTKLIEHHRYIREHGQDMPEVQEWHWQGKETID